jgi:hypothetical protein
MNKSFILYVGISLNSTSISHKNAFNLLLKVLSGICCFSAHLSMTSSVFYQKICRFWKKNVLGTFGIFFPDENSTKLVKKMSKFLYHKIILKKNLA